MAMFAKAGIVIAAAICLICYVDCGICKALVVVISSAILHCVFNQIEFDKESLRGKRVIVTGSSSGIGEHLAYEYAKLGAKILITARRENNLEKIAEKCKQLGAQQVEIVPADMSIEESRSKVVETAKEKFGGLDILILNHVGFEHTKTVDMPVLRKMLEVAFVSYVDLANQAVPLLEQSKGYLGVISSMAGKIALRGPGSYSACKFALEGYFSSLRQTLRHRKAGVSVSLAFLGFIATEAALSVMKARKTSERIAASPEKTAVAIIKGVATRTNDIIYPISMRFMLALFKVCPEFVYYLTSKYF